MDSDPQTLTSLHLGASLRKSVGSLPIYTRVLVHYAGGFGVGWYDLGSLQNADVFFVPFRFFCFMWFCNYGFVLFLFLFIVPSSMWIVQALFILLGIYVKH